MAKYKKIIHKSIQMNWAGIDWDGCMYMSLFSKKRFLYVFSFFWVWAESWKLWSRLGCVISPLFIPVAPSYTEPIITPRLPPPPPTTPISVFSVLEWGWITLLDFSNWNLFSVIQNQGKKREKISTIFLRY